MYIPCETEATERYRNLWFFSYLCNGININDMLKLKYANSRYKDFYDVYKILKNQDLANDTLTAAIHATFPVPQAAIPVPQTACTP